MSKKTPKQEPGYLQRAIEKVMAKGIKPGVQHIVVEHETTCPMVNGGIECTCVPEITICEGSA
jgi:hypothetical protein